jgi:hypothetical protein
LKGGGFVTVRTPFPLARVKEAAIGVANIHFHPCIHG